MRYYNVFILVLLLEFVLGDRIFIWGYKYVKNRRHSRVGHYIVELVLDEVGCSFGVSVPRYELLLRCTHGTYLILLWKKGILLEKIPLIHNLKWHTPL